MPKYSDLCSQIGQAGFISNPVGMCLREVRHVRGGEKSRIDRFLLESDTYGAFARGEKLDARFDLHHAQPGFLLWTHDLISGVKHPSLPVLVDWESGIVREGLEGKKYFGMLDDVRACLCRRDLAGNWQSWAGPTNGDGSDLPTPPAAEVAAACSAQANAGTTVQRTVKARVGQDWFRRKVSALWQGNCAVTGCAHPRLLRASHIKKWSECTDAERLDEHNGLLLSATLDAAFEAGLVSFTGDGTMLVSDQFSPEDTSAIGMLPAHRLRAVPSAMEKYLAYHRQKHGFATHGQSPQP